jgi:hypothetical protein
MAEVNPKPGKIDEKSNLRVFTPKEEEEAMEKAAKTGAGTHRATERGYAGGEVIEPNQMVPPGTPVSENWMAKVKKGGEDLALAVEEAQSPRNDDPDLTTLSKQALEALAVDHGITKPGNLSKQDLITAIRAAYDRDRTQ